jgi:hypothetical protein
VGGDVFEPKGTPLADQQPEDPVPLGWVADLGSFLIGDPFGDELLDPAVGGKHADRPVPSHRDIDGQLDDAFKDGLEGPFGGERHPGLDEELRAIPVLDPIRHTAKPSVHAGAV